MKTIVGLLFWYFLVQSWAVSANPTGVSTVVGPFDTKERCVEISKEAVKEGTVWVRYRATSCWESKEVKTQR